ncbi:hypothetical protein ACFLYH_01725 [Candidatus Dependentiae bacterium]
MKKTMTKLIPILVLSTLINTTPGNATNLIENSTNNNEIIENTAKQKSILSDTEKSFLNTFLGSQLRKVVQIQATKSNATKIIRIIEDLEKENKKDEDITKEVQTNKIKLLKSAKPFFDLLYNIKGSIMPLLQKALDSKLKTENEKNTNSEDYISYLYFKSNPNDAKTFFDDTLVNTQAIKTTCIEFEIIGNMIIKNLDPAILYKVNEIIKKQQGKKLNK